MDADEDSHVDTHALGDGDKHSNYDTISYCYTFGDQYFDVFADVYLDQHENHYINPDHDGDDDPRVRSVCFRKPERRVKWVWLSVLEYHDRKVFLPLHPGV
jgi:hypothetical protein